MELSDLSLEQRFKAQQCTSADELIELAQAEGVELTDEQLEEFTGGSHWYNRGNISENPIPAKCDQCGSTDTWISSSYPRIGQVAFWCCNSCHHYFYAIVDED